MIDSPKSPQQVNQSNQKYTKNERTLIKKWLFQKRILTNKNLQNLEQNAPNDKFTPFGDISEQKLIIKSAQKKYGKVCYGKADIIYKRLIEDHQQENDDSQEDVQEFTDSEDEKEDIFGWGQLPDIFKNVSEFDAVKDDQGNIYDGEFKNGVRYGRGVQFNVDGSIYQGLFKNDLYHDYGRLIYANQNIYEGHFYEGQPDSVGKYIYNANQKEKISHYTGEYKKGKRNGYGFFIWADGSSYKGEFMDNFIEGEGFYQWKDGKCYKGKWSKGKMNGFGKFIWSDQRTYEGEFLNDKKHGKGKMIFPEKNKIYDGEWKDDQPNGFGELIQKGQRRKGEWLMGKQIRWCD